MNWVDITGYAASVLVFLTFYMKDMARLRAFALFSNVAFLIYGTAIGAMPIVVLHAALLPINASRLRSELRSRGAPRRRSKGLTHQTLTTR